jgi:hypothetical protein
MNTQTSEPTRGAPAAVRADAAAKDASQNRQKEMLAAYFEKLTRAKEAGQKIVYTFVPGNLNELIGAAGMMNVLPEINALQSGMRGAAAVTSPRPRRPATPRTSAPT